MTEEQVMAFHRAGSLYHTRLAIEAETLEELDRAILGGYRRGNVETIKPRFLEVVQRCKQAREEFFVLLNSISPAQEDG